jgi:glucosamine--fructose-6-phosphate aminotransferase (isomerizing)
MGSSWFISRSVSTLFNELGISSFAINASELLHYNIRLLDRETLLFCISQSGESYEIREIMSGLNPGVHCVGIVNDEMSTLAEKAAIFLPAKAGPEEKTSTKTYTATSLVSFILGWHLAGTWNKERMNEIKLLGEKFRTGLGNYNSQINKALEFMGDITTLQVIARGPVFSTASQSALMFKEALHIPATGILGGEFRHGPMEMVSGRFKCILFASEGKTLSQSIRMAGDISGFGGKVLLITNQGVPETKNIMQIIIDEHDEYMFSVLGILPVQLLVDSYAKAKGFEAGSFSRGAKITGTE